MKRLAFISAMIIALTGNAQDTIFQYVYGGASYDIMQDVVQMPDKGYMMAGTSGSWSIQGNEIWMLRVDSAGQFMTQRTYGFRSNAEWVKDLLLAWDTTLIAAGYTNTSGAGGYDGYVIRMTQNGDTIWTRTYGGTDWEFLHSATETANQNYVFAGETHTNTNGETDAWFFKTNGNGSLIWSKTFGADSSESLNSIIETSDSNYVMVGYTTAGSSNKDILIIKTDANGDTIWVKQYGGAQDDYATRVIETQDGNYVIGGNTKSFTVGEFDMYIMQVNQNGDSLWAHSFGQNKDDILNALHQSNRGDLYISGWTDNTVSKKKNVLWYRTDPWGNFQATGNFIFAEPEDEEILSSSPTMDGGSIFGGYTRSIGYGLEDYYLVKSDSLGITVPNTTYNVSVEEQSAQDFSFYPNPASTHLYIHAGDFQTNAFRIVSVNGAIISSERMIPGQRSIRLPHLENGLYFGIFESTSGETRKVRFVISH